ncbi:MAG: hypothetical protein QXH59_08185 [Candidatus Caldarchaeum sp.]
MSLVPPRALIKQGIVGMSVILLLLIGLSLIGSGLSIPPYDPRYGTAQNLILIGAAMTVAAFGLAFYVFFYNVFLRWRRHLLIAMRVYQSMLDEYYLKMAVPMYGSYIVDITGSITTLLKWVGKGSLEGLVSGQQLSGIYESRVRAWLVFYEGDEQGQAVLIGIKHPLELHPKIRHEMVYLGGWLTYINVIEFEGIEIAKDRIVKYVPGMRRRLKSIITGFERPSEAIQMPKGYEAIERPVIVITGSPFHASLQKLGIFGIEKLGSNMEEAMRVLGQIRSAAQSVYADVSRQEVELLQKYGKELDRMLSDRAATLIVTNPPKVIQQAVESRPPINWRKVAVIVFLTLAAIVSITLILNHFGVIG